MSWTEVTPTGGTNALGLYGSSTGAVRPIPGSGGGATAGTAVHNPPPSCQRQYARQERDPNGIRTGGEQSRRFRQGGGRGPGGGRVLHWDSVEGDRHRVGGHHTGAGVLEERPRHTFLPHPGHRDGVNAEQTVVLQPLRGPG